MTLTDIFATLKVIIIILSHKKNLDKLTMDLLDSWPCNWHDMKVIVMQRDMA